MLLRTLCSMAAAVVVLPSVTLAQYGGDHSVRSYNDTRAYIRTAPDHSATVAEGYLRGLGAAYEGYGAGARDYAQGELLAQEARTLELQNDAAAREAKRVLREQFAEAQAAASARRRAAHIAERASRTPLRRVSSPVVLTRDGHVLWPAELADDALADLRGAIDSLVSSGVSATSDADLTALGDALCRRVAAGVKQDRLRPKALVSARQIVKSLRQVAETTDVRIVTARGN